LLFSATIVTGLYWVAERVFFMPQRRAAAQRLEAAASERRAELTRQGILQIDSEEATSLARQELLRQPWWLDWTAGLFPVIVVVFLLRSFLFEPFKIPSGSMIPTLMIGDLILVNKYHYGLRLPVIHTRLSAGNAPKRGDVMVFRYPPKPSLDYIKRVVGIPGDEVSYLNKRLEINGKPVAASTLPDFFDENAMLYFKQFEEKLGDRLHRVLSNQAVPGYIEPKMNFPFIENCRYSADGVVCKVPEGHFFMMGDNRDNSEDSRFWGFVPEGNIVGKAFFVWMNFSDLKRIGSFD
jgi:signal peptidase I